MEVDAPPLPADTPMHFEFPDGKATIIGTNFQLRRRDGLQSVAVNHGRVEVFADTQRILGPQEASKQRVLADRQSLGYDWQLRPTT